MRKALLAAAITSGLLAAARRRPAQACAEVPNEPTDEAQVLPAQRRSPIVEGDAELVESDEDAQDAAILALLGRL
jgi:hypothetical protein